MKGPYHPVLFTIAIIALVSLACFPGAIATSTPLAGEQALATIVAQTLSAMTQAASNPTAAPPTPTSLPATSTAVPTATRLNYCDWAGFMKDVSVPDGTTFEPGQTFVKTWRLQNRGTCAWTQNYYLVFFSGSQMGGTSAVRLPGNVPPGRTVDVSVTLTVPQAEGHYVGYWLLRNASGTLFGVGDHADKSFWVDVYGESQLPHGEVAGTLCYPSESIPRMTLYFEDASSAEVTQFQITPGQSSYSFLLPNGVYYAYAWQPDANLWGGYLRKNGTLKSFQINGGETTSGIRICDWGPVPYSKGQ
jgi:hypothetical protein